MFNFINHFKLFKIAVLIKCMEKVGLKFDSIRFEKDNYVYLNYEIEGIKGQVAFTLINPKKDGGSYKIMWTTNIDKTGRKITDYVDYYADTIEELTFAVKTRFRTTRGEKMTAADWPVL